MQGHRAEELRGGLRGQEVGRGLGETKLHCGWRTLLERGLQHIQTTMPLRRTA